MPSSRNEEDEDADSNFSVNIPPMTDALTFLTQAMSSLLANVEDDKSRRQAVAERKQEKGKDGSLKMLA